VVDEQPIRRRANDGEVIADFAIVGTLGAINILDRSDVSNANAVSFTVLGGLAGGGAVGYLLTSKYPVDTAAARLTTLGMSLGVANGALMVEPTGWSRSESVLNFLFWGGAIGAGGGFAYGQAADLTSGQAMFVANITLLGTATAALGAISGSRDGEFGNAENTALLIGMNGGAITGAIIAPHLEWSSHRANMAVAGSLIGGLAGGMLSGLLTDNKDGARTDNGEVVAATMTAGMWGGFGLSILMTRAPDGVPPKSTQRSSVQRKVASGSAQTVAPWIGHRGTLGLMAGGSF
jgi:hypothetical protein